VTMECTLADVVNNDHMYCIVAKIENVKADESVLSDNGKIDPSKLNALVFDQFQHGYYVTGEKVGMAWDAGKDLMKK
ncbi:MAG: flavin oxidoreductase, partial [Bacteroidales bacterium]|nr:flavin oxidoreductase [Bacteroidales bacterium]